MIRNHKITSIIKEILRVYLDEEDRKIGTWSRRLELSSIEIGVITDKQQDLMDKLSYKGLNVNEITYEAKKLSINIKLDFDQ